jgi:hypothetical protein
LIYVIHLLSKFLPRLGQPASQWGNHLSGAVITNQIPVVTVKLPATAFSQQNGGHLFHVGHPQCMAAVYGREPQLELLGKKLSLP